MYYAHTGVKNVFSVSAGDIEANTKGEIAPKTVTRHEEKYNRPLDGLIGSTSKHRVKPEVIDFFERDLKPASLLRTGGAGKKALLVVEGETDYCIHYSGKASRWDTIAPEVLLRCVGG